MAIAVLMSTYNGEKYVKEQINSIISQNLRETIHLYIRDDGSSDDTIRIIEKYASDYGNIIFINRERIDNVGIQKVSCQTAALFPFLQTSAVSPAM